MRFDIGDKVAHKLNPLHWRGEVTEVKLNGRIKVMLTTGIEVEVGPFVPLKLDVFTDQEIKVILNEKTA